MFITCMSEWKPIKYVVGIGGTVMTKINQMHLPSNLELSCDLLDLIYNCIHLWACPHSTNH